MRPDGQARCRFLLVDDQRHEDEIFRLRRVLDAVLLAVGAERRRAGVERDLAAVVVVERRAGEDVVRLRVAVVLVDAERAARRDDDRGAN